MVEAVSVVAGRVAVALEAVALAVEVQVGGVLEVEVQAAAGKETAELEAAVMEAVMATAVAAAFSSPSRRPRNKSPACRE